MDSIRFCKEHWNMGQFVMNTIAFMHHPEYFYKTSTWHREFVNVFPVCRYIGSHINDDNLKGFFSHLITSNALRPIHFRQVKT